MTAFLISYDLRKPGRDYKPVITALQKQGAVRPLESVWLLVSTTTALAIRESIKPLVDSNDRFMVVALGSDWASFNLDDASVNWLKAHVRNY